MANNNNDKVQLVVSMIVAHEKYGDAIRFTKEDIDIIIQENVDWERANYNELAAIILWRSKYITLEQFAKKMDLEVENGTYYFTEIISRFIG